MFGLGPGTSRARWGMLPNSHTDFIASIIGEEYGFVGLVIFIIILVLLIISLFGLAISTESEFKKLVFSGLGAWVLIQVVINLGGALVYYQLQVLSYHLFLTGVVPWWLCLAV